MKLTRIALATLAAALATLAAPAQDHVNAPQSRTLQRHEMILPRQVAGYNLYKADLHTHTIYSDGQVTPQYRVREAWSDGLDIVAIADHIEYRSNEQAMLDHLRGYVADSSRKAVNASIINRPADERGIRVDLNVSTRLAQSAAKEWGITVVPATEITREPVALGHYNALFTTDNNAIYHPDPMQALRNAREQGAFIMHNHPGWRRKSVAMTDFEKQAYAQGLIDGVEVANGRTYYPPIISRCIDLGLAMMASTDVHLTTHDDYDEVVASASYRNMTLILARDRSLEALREALDAGRTIAFNGNNFFSREELLAELCLGCLEAHATGTDSKGQTTLNLLNKTSVPFTVKFGSATLRLEPFCSVKLTAREPEQIALQVLNMWCYQDRHPSVSIPIH